MTTIRLLVAEDHAIVRAGLRQLLALAPDIEVVAEVADGWQLEEALVRVSIDALLLDMSMPGPSGIDMIKAIRDGFPALPILVLSMHAEVQVVSRVLKAGASGFLTKDSDPALLVPALRRTVAGERYVDPGLAQKMVLHSTSSRSDPRFDELSDREYQVLAAVAGGVKASDLARELGLSPKTVSAHKTRLMNKLGIKSTAELVRYAIDQRLID